MSTKPAWLTKRVSSGFLEKTDNYIRENCLHTVCEEARCPNLCECYSKKTATFLLLGKSCTRACPFCEIGYRAVPSSPDVEEPRHVVESISALGLKHVVLTMVTRDDLADGGAEHVASVVRLIKQHCPRVTIEVLTSDFEGNQEALSSIVCSGIDVFNHNVETVERLTPKVRHKATYHRSLELLKSAYMMRPSLKIKSGLMVGFGECSNEVHATLRDLYQAHVSFVTIGQYLQPSSRKMPVQEYIHPDQFQAYKEFGESIGLKQVFSGPFVRSSYHASAFL